MTGMSNVISAKGNYNLNSSAAAMNMTQVQKQEIQNKQDNTNAYFAMRETNREATAAEAGPKLTAEQLARLAHETAPKPLSPGEFDAVTGTLDWPQALQLDEFASDREQLEKLFASFTEMGALKYADQTKARQIINSMNKRLKSKIHTLPAQDYSTCKSFLQSLIFTTCKCRLS